MAFPFQVVTAEAKESKRYYEEEEDDDEYEGYEHKEEYSTQPATAMQDDARQQALEQQRQQQQYMIEQQALFEQQLLVQRRAIEERQRQLEEQRGAQARAIEEQELLASQADNDLELFQISTTMALVIRLTRIRANMKRSMPWQMIITTASAMNLNTFMPWRGGNPTTIEKKFRAMGTDVIVAVISDDAVGARADTEEAARAIADFERRFSRFLPASEVCSLNASGGAVCRTSADMAAMLAAAQYWYKDTGGIFDPRYAKRLKMLGMIKH